MMFWLLALGGGICATAIAQASPSSKNSEGSTVGPKAKAWQERTGSGVAAIWRGALGAHKFLCTERGGKVRVY